MINFEYIKYKNFLSTGNNFTEIYLNRSPNTFIYGQNGSGKSTILCSLCYVLFNKPFRKINKGGLVNSINNADCVVEVQFTIGSKLYKIIRGMKPAIFEIYCNGVLVNQDAKAKDYQEYLESNILKFNYKSFTQIVILGSASFVPFMQLSAGDRRSIIEDLLDIQIFTTMNDINKEKLVSLKESITELNYKISLVNNKIESQNGNIESHKKQNNNIIESKNNEILETEKNITELEVIIESTQKEIEILQLNVTDKKSIDTKTKKLVQIEAKIENNIDKISDEIDFYSAHDNCPTCKQVLDPIFKESQVSENTAKKEKLATGLSEVADELSKLYKQASAITELNSKITKLNNIVIQHTSTIKSANRTIDTLKKQIKELSKEKGDIKEQIDKLKVYQDELAGYNVMQSDLIVERQYGEYCGTLLKDSGIKTRIIKQYLPIINKYVNKYLAAMGFFVNFTLNEQFEESIKSRHRDDFSYSSFSEGEKSKINLSILLCWRQIAKMKNSVHTNLLILDEVFDSSLDATSTEALMSILKDIGEDTNVFVISHRPDNMAENFRSSIKFEKNNNFSSIVK